MKVFLDANILVAVLNKEYPTFSYAARVLSLADNPKYQLFTSPICFAIAFYFSSKKSGAVLTKKKLGLLAEKIQIAENKQADVLKVANNKQILDFEDGLEYYAALNAECSCIVTEDLGDFHFSSMPVLNAENFLRQHVI
jgi:predicted nucleic acid-binding protein